MSAFTPSPLPLWCWPPGAELRCTSALVFHSVPTPRSSKMWGFPHHGEEVFCPFRHPWDENPLILHVPIPCILTPLCLRTPMANLHPWAFALHLLRENSAQSCSFLFLPLSLCLASTCLKTLQNTAAPCAVLGIMGSCNKEAKGMFMLLMLGLDKPGVFLVVLDSFNQFCDKSRLLRFGDSLFEATEPLTM